MGKICVNMIVKNEAKNLPRLFKSIHSYIDYYVISDTGSTDNTIEVIQELAKEYNLTGIITQDPWLNFEHNRNITLQNAYQYYADKCDWFLIIDADEELILLDNQIFDKLSINRNYNLYRIYRGIALNHTGLISTKDKSWSWKGKIHNQLVNTTPNIDTITDAYIWSHYFIGSKSQQFTSQYDKSKNDILQLHTELNHQSISNQNQIRYFILANELIEIKEFDKAKNIYLKIIEVSASKEVKYFAAIQIAAIHFNQNNFSESQRWLNNAIHFDEKRKEAHYYLAKIKFLSKNFNEAIQLLEKIENEVKFPSNAPFMFDFDIYNWKVDFELASLYFLSKERIKLSLKIKKLEENLFFPSSYYSKIQLLSSLTTNDK